MYLKSLDAKEAFKNGIRADFLNGSIDSLTFSNEYGTFHLRKRDYSITLCKEEKLTEKVFVVKGDGILKEFTDQYSATNYKNRFDSEEYPLTMEQVDKEITLESKPTSTYPTDEIPF